MYKRILIFTGGNLGDWALEYINPEDMLVGVDRGALFLVKKGFRPGHVMGDFDSVTEKELDCIRGQCPSINSCDPVDKDYTDTELAFNWAIGQRPEEVLIFGALGTRLDHSLANIQLLKRGVDEGVSCRIVDEKNEAFMTRDQATVYPSKFKYVSLLPMTMEVKGVSLKGFKYPLMGATLTLGQSLAVSNLLQAEQGKIDIETGLLLIIMSMD